MSDWNKTTLGELVEFQRGHDLPTSQRRRGSVPVVGSAGVSGSHREAMYEGPGVAIGRSGSSIGVATYVSEPYWPLNTTLFVKDFKGNDPEWVYRLLKTVDFTGYNSGSAQPSLNRNHLRGIAVSAPSVDEQRAIAEVLGALDDKIAANSRLIETADELARTRTRVALTDARVDLSSIAEITMGSSPPGSSYNEVQNGVVFYQGVRDFGVRFPTNRVWTTESVRMAEPGDTLLSVRAPVGRTNLAAEPTCIGRGLAAVRSKSGHPMTMFHILRDDHAAWAPYEAEGTVFGSINKKQLASLQVATVAPEQSAELEGVLSAVELRIAAAIAESERLAGTRDALLPLLMSGKATVRDADSVVEGVV